MSLLTGKTAIITGGSRGIGKGIVETFAKQGANVAFTYLSSEAAAQQFETELNAMGIKAKAYKSDASDYAQAQSLIEQVIEDFGSVEVLINNAGVTKDNLMLRMSEDDWDKVMNINLKSAFNLTKAVIKPMMKQRLGSIVNISSVVGVSGNAGQANYAASKAGMLGFTKSIAKELGSRNIRCNAIAPGFIATEMTEELADDVRDAYLANIPMKRFGTPEEVANACVYLASDLSAYVSGQTINVCGALNVN